MKKLFGLSALVSPRVALGVGAVTLVALLGGTGCGLSYSLTGIYVEPTDACLYPGSTAQFTAYGTFTEGGHSMVTRNISSQVTWTTSLSDLATVNTSGLATAGTSYVGNTPVTATTEGEFGILVSSANLVVSTSCTTSTSIAKPAFHIVPASVTLNQAGDTERPLAIAESQTGGAQTDMTRNVAWTSSNPQVATVDRTGLITGVGSGDATITAAGKTPNGETISATQTVHSGASNRGQ